MKARTYGIVLGRGAPIGVRARVKVRVLVWGAPGVAGPVQEWDASCVSMVQEWDASCVSMVQEWDVSCVSMGWTAGSR